MKTLEDLNERGGVGIDSKCRIKFIGSSVWQVFSFDFLLEGSFQCVNPNPFCAATSPISGNGELWKTEGQIPENWEMSWIQVLQAYLPMESSRARSGVSLLLVGHLLEEGVALSPWVYVCFGNRVQERDEFVQEAVLLCFGCWDFTAPVL